MMMALGQFVFSLPTLAYQELQRQTQWRFAETAVLEVRPRQQYLGLGNDTISLRGELYPEIAGGPRNIEILRRMGDSGRGWPLIDGLGRVYGLFILESLNENKSVLLDNGQARKIDFDLSLKRVDDGRVDLLGYENLLDGGDVL